MEVHSTSLMHKSVKHCEKSKVGHIITNVKRRGKLKVWFIIMPSQLWRIQTDIKGQNRKTARRRIFYFLISLIWQFRIHFVWLALVEGRDKATQLNCSESFIKVIYFSVSSMSVIPTLLERESR